jgi:hypothetical protein
LFIVTRTSLSTFQAYDYSGSWDNFTGHASNLAPNPSNPNSTPFNTRSVVQAYINAGVPSSKLNLGMPLYGRAFTNTAGLGQPYKGIGTGTWEAGVYDFKDMPLPGSTVYWDKTAYATYSYDNSTGMLVSYDTVELALTKVDFIKQNNLGGAMWWEVSGDRNDSGSIISNVSLADSFLLSQSRSLGTPSLTSSSHRLSISYPAPTARVLSRRTTGSTTLTLRSITSKKGSRAKTKPGRWCICSIAL